MIHGMINVYKEKGYTSHDVVARLRGITGQKKIGHTGTLDPDAEGVLPVCLGRGTKLCDLLTDKDKVYETVLLLGQSTDTQDISGQVLEVRSIEGLEVEMVKRVINGFIGLYEQVPPMYSALKVGGKKLYELAREGQVIERKARPVEIHSIQILKMDLPRVHMEISCSKGTYIRTLCHDIGDKLGVGGCMESLLRTQVGPFGVENSLRLDQIQNLKEENRLEEIVVPVDAMFSDYPAVQAGGKWAALARNGNVLPAKAVVAAPLELRDGAVVRLYDAEENFIALYIWKEETREYHIKKMFFNS